jgi:hypothetical protein
MLASFVSQPTDKELCAKFGDGIRRKGGVSWNVRNLLDFSIEGVILRPG